METIITKAIEGKWKTSGTFLENPKFVVYRDSVLYGIWYVRWDTFPSAPMEGCIIRQSDMFLDPSFWKSIGLGLWAMKAFMQHIWQKDIDSAIEWLEHLIKINNEKPTSQETVDGII